MIVNYCADCGNEQHYRPECCDNWHACDCPKVWECADTACRCTVDGDLVVCGSCARAKAPAGRAGDHTADPRVDAWWYDAARRALEWMAETGKPFDAYDLTELGVPDPDHPNRWGSLFRVAASDGLITPVGFRESKRPSRAGGVCRVWVGRAAS